MGVDQVDAAMLQQSMMRVARGIRADYRYSEDECMQSTAILIKPDESFVTIALLWQNEQEKRYMADGLMRLARLEHALAAAIASDTRWVNSKEFCDHFNIPQPTGEPDGYQKFKKVYRTILDAHGGEIKKLPRQLWHEAVCVMVKGPGLEPSIIMAHYEEGDNDRVRWLPEEKNDDHGRTEFNLLPDWWTIQ